jgi:hypothetical protein
MMFTPWVHNTLVQKVVLLVTRFYGSNLKVLQEAFEGVANICAPNDSFDRCKIWEEMLAKLSTNRC